MYNMTAIEQANNIVGQAAGLNDLSGGFFTLVGLIILYIVIIAFYKETDFRFALLGASVVMGLLSLFALGLGWISIELVIIPIVLAFLSMMLTMFVD